MKINKSARPKAEAGEMMILEKSRKFKELSAGGFIILCCAYCFLFFAAILGNTHIYKDPVEFGPMFYHHEEHENHEGMTEYMIVPSSCPSRPSW